VRTVAAAYPILQEGQVKKTGRNCGVTTQHGGAATRGAAWPSPATSEHGRGHPRHVINAEGFWIEFARAKKCIAVDYFNNQPSGLSHNRLQINWLEYFHLNYGSPKIS
jgi:hypothetical protein